MVTAAASGIAQKGVWPLLIDLVEFPDGNAYLMKIYAFVASFGGGMS
jgi:hypothetical protein